MSVGCKDLIPVYDGSDEPFRKKRYRKSLTRAVALTAIGAATLALIGGVALRGGDPDFTLVVLVFLPPLVLGVIAPLLLVLGERDSLRIFSDRLELPLRSSFDALIGKSNPVVDLHDLEAVYLPPVGQESPFVGFEDANAGVYLVHKDYIGDLEKVEGLLAERGISIIRAFPPKSRVVWNLPRWMAKGPKRGSH